MFDGESGLKTSPVAAKVGRSMLRPCVGPMPLGCALVLWLRRAHPRIAVRSAG
jgi:hypothetical protein